MNRLSFSPNTLRFVGAPTSLIIAMGLVACGDDSYIREAKMNVVQAEALDGELFIDVGTNLRSLPYRPSTREMEDGDLTFCDRTESQTTIRGTPFGLGPTDENGSWVGFIETDEQDFRGCDGLVWVAAKITDDKEEAKRLVEEAEQKPGSQGAVFLRSQD